jgi:hypothetical protein
MSNDPAFQFPVNACVPSASSFPVWRSLMCDALTFSLWACFVVQVAIF